MLLYSKQIVLIYNLLPETPYPSTVSAILKLVPLTIM